MALKYVSSIDLNLNQLLNAVVQNLASAPTSGNKKGRVYFDTSTNKPYWYNGSAWITFASATDFSTLSGNVTTLQGYFTNGKANNADKLDGVSLEGLLTSLTSNTTNAVSLTVGGTTKNITVDAIKTSLGLKSLAYKDSIAWSDITSGKPTTIAGYGITDAYTKTEVNNIAAKYLPLAGGTMSGTITFGTSGKSITAAGVANLAATTLASLTVSGTSTLNGNTTVADGKYLYFGGTSNYILGTDDTLTVDASTYLDFAIGGTRELELTANELAPYTNGGLSLGTSSKKWSSLFVSGNASIGGTMSVTQIKIGKVVIKEDSDGVLKFYYDGDEAGETNTATIYATGGVSALGLGTGGTAGGSGVNLLTSWTDEYDETYALSAALGIDLYNNKASKTYVADAVSVVSGNLADTNARVSALEAYFSTSEDSDELINKWNEITDFLEGVAETDNLTSLLASKVDNVAVAGSGNAVTTASISGSKLTLTKGATFLTSHQTLYDLIIKNSAGTTQLTYKPATNGTYSLTLTKAMVGLGNVENTALSSWKGTSNITTVGTITSGTWNGSAITSDYISSVAWNKLSGKPTTISGYGITDAYTKTQVNNLLAAESHTVKRFNSTLSGDGTTTSFTVTHSFNTKDVIVFVYEVSSPYQQVFVDIAMTSTTAITVTFASAPASGTNYKVVILA